MQNTKKDNLSSSVIINKILLAYKKWQIVQKNIPKIHRYSLGIKIDTYFVDILEMINYAQFGEKKTIYLEKAIIQNNILKSLLLILLEIDCIDRDKYIDICKNLEELGKIAYSWKSKYVVNKTTNQKLISGNKSII